MLGADIISPIVTIISSTIVGIIVLIVGKHLNAFDRTNRKTAFNEYVGTSLKEDIAEMKGDMQYIRKKVEDLNVKSETSIVRIDKLEKSFNNSSPIH